MYGQMSFDNDLPLLKWVFMIWCFGLYLYALILLQKTHFEKNGPDYNKPKLTEMREGFVGIVSRMRWQGQTQVPMFPMNGIPNI